MNAGLLILEYAVLGLAIFVIVLDLFTQDDKRPLIGRVAAGFLGVIFVYSCFINPTGTAFDNSYVMDPLALFFKRFFLLAGVIVMVISTEYSKHIRGGVSEFFALQLFALLGMMFAASANHFMLLFVALELMTVTFYILVGYLRHRVDSLEAGVKYLILAALSSGFLVYGIALVYGVTGEMGFAELSAKLRGDQDVVGNPIVKIGLLLIFLGLAFKLAAFPLQIWAPDVYNGAPTPTAAFLAVGSKAAGVVLLLRLIGQAAYDVALDWEKMLMVLSALTILYGSLCALPQRNLKRLLGYSSIASAGYLLMGFAAMNQTGSTAILYYMGGYLFTVLGAFAVIAVVVKQAGLEDVNSLAGLSQRSPMLAAVLALSMVSLAGIPPLAGFFGKFLLFKAVLERAVQYDGYLILIAVAAVGVLISMYYYFNVVRAIYWSKEPADLTPIEVSGPMRLVLLFCVSGMLWLGLFPDGFRDFGSFLDMASKAAAVLQTS
jgi:NADH-quinone oxidoreductase subunit N